MGHWNGDRDCDPAQLTGCLLGGQASSLPSTEHATPLRLSEAGFSFDTWHVAVSGASRFLFDATSHRCAMPIAMSAPTAVSAIEIARAISTILTVSHRDKDRTQSCQHPAHFW